MLFSIKTLVAISCSGSCSLLETGLRGDCYWKDCLIVVCGGALGTKTLELLTPLVRILFALSEVVNFRGELGDSASCKVCTFDSLFVFFLVMTLGLCELEGL